MSLSQQEASALLQESEMIESTHNTLAEQGVDKSKVKSWRERQPYWRSFNACTASPLLERRSGWSM